MSGKSIRKTPVLILIAALLVLCMSLLWILRQAHFQQIADTYAAKAAAEKNWILSCQTDDGLILYSQWDESLPSQNQVVVPYFSSIAALGLLSGTVTEGQAEGVKRYILWYLEHLNTEVSDPVNGDGTIYNYRVTLDNGNTYIESTDEYDSVDAYAALFLMAADMYGQKVDRQFLAKHRDEVIRVADALLRTIQENGLSYAKAQYPIQYLMDNTEVYAGLRAGARLLKQIAPETAYSETLNLAADRLQTAFEELLWNQDTGFYEIGLTEDSEPLECNAWNEFYPDSIAQLFPACFSVTDAGSSRAESLYRAFCGEWDWAAFEHQCSRESTFYWCVLAYIAAVHNDEERLQGFLQNYEEILAQNTRSYPLYTGDAGWIALACGYMEDRYRSRF